MITDADEIAARLGSLNDHEAQPERHKTAPPGVIIGPFIFASHSEAFHQIGIHPTSIDFHLAVGTPGYLAYRVRHRTPPAPTTTPAKSAPLTLKAKPDAPSTIKGKGPAVE